MAFRQPALYKIACKLLVPKDLRGEVDFSVYGFFELVKYIDLSIYQFLARFTGNSFLNFIAVQQESNEVFKGGLFLAAYWYFWLRPGSDQEMRRRAILAILVGTFLAIVVSVGLTTVTQFRTRPFFATNLAHRLQADPGRETLTSFPSDTATYFSALALGLLYLARRVPIRIAILLYTAVWILLPRMYLGLHYASDVVAGTTIGVVAVWVVLRADWQNDRLSGSALGFSNAHPELFYPAAFLVTFEMARVFYDIRVFKNQFAQTVGFRGVAVAALLAIAGTLASIGFLRTSRRRSEKTATRS